MWRNEGPRPDVILEDMSRSKCNGTVTTKATRTAQLRITALGIDSCGNIPAITRARVVSSSYRWHGHKVSIFELAFAIPSISTQLSVTSNAVIYTCKVARKA